MISPIYPKNDDGNDFYGKAGVQRHPICCPSGPFHQEEDGKDCFGHPGTSCFIIEGGY
jgi:hypothetical protein